MVRSNRMPKVSGELRVFINMPDANAGTPTENNPNLAGAIGLFGMAIHSHAKPSAAGGGASANAAPALPHADNHGHGGGTSIPTVNDEERFDLELELAPALRQLAAKTGQADMKIVAVDSDGKPMSADHFDLQGIDLLVD